MSDNIFEIPEATLNTIRSFADSKAVFGEPIHTLSGVTVIPISQIKLSFIGGGIDVGKASALPKNALASGSGTGLTITPVAFLTVSKNGEVNYISIDDQNNKEAFSLPSIIENAPEIIKSIKKALT